MARAEQMPQHVLVTLARRTEQVRAPDEHHARMVLLRIRVGEGEVQRAILELAQRIVGRGHAGRFRLAHQLQRIAVQLRRARQPAHAHGAQVQIGQAAAVLAGIGQRREQLVHLQLLVTPLPGVEVEVRGAVHVPRRAAPVQAERQRLPAGLRAQLFLAHVMRPAAAALTHAAAHHQHVDDAAVDHVHVVPMVQAGAHDHHRLAFGVAGV
ncbi:hypothetical protein G6F35_014315 [Rhizopus arrhizus]|nr:hypothetical protein G6F35_014315 [Rhizopus arrhizus]